jgi:C4-dicarboxylate transporter, DctM subunit
MIIATAWATGIRPQAGAQTQHWKFNARELGAAAWVALPELLIPVVSLGSIFTGLATPVEAAAITAFYALLVETLVYRELKPAALLHAVRECGLLIGGVLLILGVAKGLTNYMIYAQVPTALVALVTAHISSKVAFIALLNVVLLVVGCLMDVFSAIIVVVPLITELGAQYGLHPVHLGALFLANLGLGFLTPPVGMNLFLAAYRFKRPMGEVLRGALPYFWIQLVAVIVISYWPALTLAVPGWFGY